MRISSTYLIELAQTGTIGTILAEFVSEPGMLGACPAFKRLFGICLVRKEGEVTIL